MDPRGTQRELQALAAKKRREETAAWNRKQDLVSHDVRTSVADVFAQVPWFPRVVGAMFIAATQEVAEKHLDVNRERLSAMMSQAFTETLNECASFGGLKRMSETAPPEDMLNLVQHAATPDIMATQLGALGLPMDFLDEHDYPDEEATVAPISDEEAEQLGVLPDC